MDTGIAISGFNLPNSSILNNNKLELNGEKYEYSIGYVIGDIKDKTNLIGSYMDMSFFRFYRDFNVFGISLAPCNSLFRIIGLQLGVYNYAKKGSVCL